MALAVAFQEELQVLVLQDALADDAKFVDEHGRREALAPHLAVDQLDELGAVEIVFQRTVGLDHAFQLGLAQPCTPDRFEGLAEGVEMIRTDR